MTYWIKKIAGMLSTGAFFIGFFMSIDPTNPFDLSIFTVAVLKGASGAVFFWAAGFIIADIIIKGLVTGIDTGETDTVDGGLLQRIYTAQSARIPGNEENAEKIPTIRINAQQTISEKQKSGAKL
jgi:hypothetical protein